MDYNFLNSIFKTSEMGIVGIDDIIENVKDNEFSKVLLHQREDYEKIIKKCDKLFKDNHFIKKDLGAMTKASSKIMSKVKLMKNENDSKIAKMMIEGTNKGIIKINKGLNENEDAKELKKLALDLLKIMENNLNDLKIYL